MEICSIKHAGMAVITVHHKVLFKVLVGKAGKIWLIYTAQYAGSGRIRTEWGLIISAENCPSSLPTE